jgi:hypothetical protein
MLVFDDRRLADVIAQANRYSEHPIVLADRASGALHFTGTVAAKDTEGLAGLLAASFHLALTRDAEGNFILSSLDTKKVPGVSRACLVSHLGGAVPARRPGHIHGFVA